MTNKQMRDQVVAWLGLQDISSYDETQAVSDKLYQGALDLLSRTRCVVRCIQLTTFADQDEYLLDQKLIALVDVEDGKRRRLRRDQNQQAMQSPMVIVPPSGTGDATPVVGVYGFDLIRADLLRIVPTPTEDGQVQVYGVIRPDPMTEDDDSPSDPAHGAIPEEYHDAIVTYALWKMADYSDDQGTQQGEYYRTLYEGQDGRGGRISQIKVLVNKRGTARAPRARVRLSTISGSGSFT